MLEVINLSVFYGSFCAVSELSLAVVDKQIVALLGPNGAGKTSTLNCLIGLITHKSGMIRWCGKDIGHLGTAARVRLGIGLVPEGGKLFPFLTVQENLKLGAYGKRGALAERMEFVLSIFPELRNLMRRMAWSLSGGERQMLAVGRALMADPALLLVDEISLGLAPSIVDRLYYALILLKEKGKSIIVADQNIATALRVADKVYVMLGGKILLAANARDITEKEVVQILLRGSP